MEETAFFLPDAKIVFVSQESDPISSELRCYLGPGPMF
jgi:hypothetical protein